MSRFLKQFPLEEPEAVTVESFEFLFKADANNKIFTAKFFPLKESRLSSHIAAVLEHILDQNIDLLISDMLVHQDIDTLSFEYLEASFIVREALKLSFHPDQAVSFNANTILCRCSKIDCHMFSQGFEEVGQDLNKLRTKTNAGLICGSCTPQLVEYAEHLKNPLLYHEGKSVEEVFDIITKALDDFAEYSSLDLEEAVFKVLDITFPRVKISVANFKGDKSSLQRPIENYIYGKLNAVVQIEITSLQ